MPRQRRETSNVGVRHGEWGEDVAVEFLRVHGYEIVDRNVRPCSRDRRLEIDVVAYDRMYDVMTFVEVKQHAQRSPYAMRLRSVDRRKRDLLRRACRTWIAKERWAGAYRFERGVPRRDRPHSGREALREDGALRGLEQMKSGTHKEEPIWAICWKT